MYKSERKDTGRQRKPRTFKMGNYLIVTDGRETEVNYFKGLRGLLAPEEREHLRIEVVPVQNARSLVNKCEVIRDKQTYSEVWIVFDRDLVQNFDAIIEEAQKKGICVA